MAKTLDHKRFEAQKTVEKCLRGQDEVREKLKKFSELFVANADKRAIAEAKQDFLALVKRLGTNEKARKDLEVYFTAADGSIVPDKLPLITELSKAALLTEAGASTVLNTAERMVQQVPNPKGVKKILEILSKKNEDRNSKYLNTVRDLCVTANLQTLIEPLAPVKVFLKSSSSRKTILAGAVDHVQNITKSLQETRASVKDTPFEKQVRKVEKQAQRKVALMEGWLFSRVNRTTDALKGLTDQLPLFTEAKPEEEKASREEFQKLSKDAALLRKQTALVVGSADSSKSSARLPRPLEAKVMEMHKEEAAVTTAFEAFTARVGAVRAHEEQAKQLLQEATSVLLKQSTSPTDEVDNIIHFT